MKKIAFIITIIVGIASSNLSAATNFVGDVNAQYGSFYATYHVYALGGLVYAGQYVQAEGAGYFGDFLRVGGASNYPASKSVQIGQYATTDSFTSLVVGRYNINKAKDGTTAPNSSTWNGNDPLLVAGNGADSSHPNNAFAVYKDGTVTMSKAQGDISMGQFGN